MPKFPHLAKFLCLCYRHISCGGRSLALFDFVPMALSSSTRYHSRFFAYPYCFQAAWDWTAEQSSLSFLGVLVGVILGCPTITVSDCTWWFRRFPARGRKIHPEDRLLWLIVAAILLPEGLFWFAWTSSLGTPWPAQVCASILIGAEIVLNLLSTTSYVIECYLRNANSAMAAYVSVRSAVAASFPLFAIQMFEKLGAQRAASLLASLCVALAHTTAIFWVYGEKIGSWSWYSYDG